MSFGEFKDDGDEIMYDEGSLEEFKDIDQIDASFDRKTDKKFENLSNIISEDQESRNFKVSNMASGLTELKNFIEKDTSEESMQYEMNSQYLEQANILVNMLKQNPKTLIQSNQVKVYVTNHHNFLKSDKILLVI
tara:strand:- start:381 stop:785 length:405 start_codon:yes stop_codon:yes gene_type:complete